MERDEIIAKEKEYGLDVNFHPHYVWVYKGCDHRTLIKQAEMSRTFNGDLEKARFVASEKVIKRYEKWLLRNKFKKMRNRIFEQIRNILFGQ